MSEDDLRSAQPRLICRVERRRDECEQKLMPYISEADPGWDELLSEGYDDNPFNPLGPVYWRVIIRANEKLYASTFVATREAIRKCWGSAGLAHCDPITGTAAARIETYLETIPTHERH
jgi:hypothetical protein